MITIEANYYRPREGRSYSFQLVYSLDTNHGRLYKVLLYESAWHM
jgi:hypothetical protein